MSVAAPDPRQAAWRRALLVLSLALTVVGSLVIGGAAGAVVVLVGWPTSASDIIEIGVVFAVAAPLLLPGLIGLQVALSGERGGTTAFAAARVGATLAIAGSICLSIAAWSEWTAVAFSVAAIAASVVVAATPSGRPTPTMRWLNCGALLLCAAPAGFLIAELTRYWGGDWLEWLALGLGGALPILTAIAMCALILTEPQGGASDE